jgi:hypothetical protein
MMPNKIGYFWPEPEDLPTPMPATLVYLLVEISTVLQRRKRSASWSNYARHFSSFNFNLQPHY